MYMLDQDLTAAVNYYPLIYSFCKYPQLNIYISFMPLNWALILIVYWSAPYMSRVKILMRVATDEVGGVWTMNACTSRSCTRNSKPFNLMLPPPTPVYMQPKLPSHARKSHLKCEHMFLGRGSCICNYTSRIYLRIISAH